MVDKNYKQYIESPAWKRKRLQALRFYGQRCEVCGSMYRLEVNHLSYLNFGNEPMSDLNVLCHRCHQEYRNLQYKLGYRHRSKHGRPLVNLMKRKYRRK